MFYLGLSRSILDYLGLFWCISVHLCLSWLLSVDLVRSWSIAIYPGLSLTIVDHLGLSQTISYKSEASRFRQTWPSYWGARAPKNLQIGYVSGWCKIMLLFKIEKYPNLGKYGFLPRFLGLERASCSSMANSIIDRLIITYELLLMNKTALFS